MLKTLDSMLPNCKGLGSGEEDTSGFCLKKRHVYFFCQPLSSCISKLNCFYKKYILEELLPDLPYGGGPSWAMNVKVTNKHLSVGVKHFVYKSMR